jgi:hypothetical protein
VNRAALLLTLAVLLAGCTKVEQPAPATPEPDRVVGIELKCDVVMYIGDPKTVRMFTYTGWDVCAGPVWRPGIIAGAVPEGFFNLRKELTVRTAAGDHYIVSYGAEHDVWLGMEWPPK